MEEKKRKGRGKPFPTLSQDKLDCIWCGHRQKKAEILRLFRRIAKNRFCYACDRCTRSLFIYRSKSGRFSVQDNLSRYRKNVELGVNRIHPTMNIEVALIRKRRQKFLTQVETAKMLDVSQGTYNQWESGKSYPSKKHMPRVLGFLEITADQLPPRTIDPLKF